MSKALQNPDSPHPHPTALIQEPMLFAQALHSTLNLGKIVTRKRREQMMLYLIIEASCKNVTLLQQLPLSSVKDWNHDCKSSLL